MELYHGSYTAVSKPQIIQGRYTKDFGPGFYCTKLQQQAERWAGKYDTPVVCVYTYAPTHQIAFCTEASLECLTFQSNYSL